MAGTRHRPGRPSGQDGLQLRPRQRSTDQLWSDDVLFPLEPGIRLQLVGRITDQMAIEATCWGLQHWSVGRTIYADPAGNRLGEFALAANRLLRQFLGLHLHQRRCQRRNQPAVQVVLVRSLPGVSWLWGVRYFYLSDDFILSGSDLYTNTDEDLNWRTKNNLIGMQLGLQWTWGWDRFQLSTEGKVGLFANVYSQQGTDSINGSTSSPGFDVSHSGTDLSALFEFSLLARFRLTECMWIRAGYQYYCATGLATGPRQLGPACKL